MSIIHSLKKILDPNQARIEEADRKLHRERKKQEVPGDPARYECRVCGYSGEEPVFCPKCLAETMREAKDKR